MTPKELNVMTCRRAQSLITPFIKDKLNITDTEEFLEHINSCQECREELEVYYILLTAMKQLDEDKQLSDDFGQDLAYKLDTAHEKVLHVKFTYYRKRGILILIVLFLAVFFSMRYAENQNSNKNVTESNYKLRMMYNEERYDRIDEALHRYLRDQQPGW